DTCAEDLYWAGSKKTSAGDMECLVHLCEDAALQGIPDLCLKRNWRAMYGIDPTVQTMTVEELFSNRRVWKRPVYGAPPLRITRLAADGKTAQELTKEEHLVVGMMYRFTHRFQDLGKALRTDLKNYKS